jgi:hypothetical protein
MTALTESTKKMPYGMRFLAREILAALRVSDSHAPYDRSINACLDCLP